MKKKCFRECYFVPGQVLTFKIESHNNQYACSWPLPLSRHCSIPLCLPTLMLSKYDSWKPFSALNSSCNYQAYFYGDVDCSFFAMLHSCTMLPGKFCLDSVCFTFLFCSFSQPDWKTQFHCVKLSNRSITVSGTTVAPVK